MHKSLFFVLVITLLLSACVTPPNSDSELLAELKKVDETVAQLELALSQKFALSCEKNIKSITGKIDKLRRAKQTTKVVERCPKNRGSKTTDGKLLLGAVEKVHLVKEDVKFDARIDTGADTSSIGVFKWKRFERDGKKWVRFALKKDDDAKVYEYPIFDTVRIKQSSTINEDRIEIKMDIEMGGKKYKKQLFNLADRSHLDYQLLIGRSFLRDIAIVDVGRKRLLRGG